MGGRGSGGGRSGGGAAKKVPTGEGIGETNFKSKRSSITSRYSYSNSLFGN